MRLVYAIEIWLRIPSQRPGACGGIACGHWCVLFVHPASPRWKPRSTQVCLLATVDRRLRLVAINVPYAVGSVGSVGATCCSRVRFRLPCYPPMTAIRVSPKALRKRLGSMYRASVTFPGARFYATADVTTRAGRCRACMPRAFLVGARPATGHGRSRAPRSAFPVGRQGVARTIPGAHDELYATAPGTKVAPRHVRCRPRARVL